MKTPITIPQSARAVFQDGMEHLAQQKASRFQKYAIVKTGCTEKASAHRLSAAFTPTLAQATTPATPK